MSLQVTIPIPNLILNLLLGLPIPEDRRVVIGHSMLAVLAETDPGSVFLPDAVWHDAATTAGASIQKEWPWWKVTDEFHKKMRNTALWEAQNRPGLTYEERVELLYDLRTRANYLAMLSEKWGRELYEGKLL